MNFRRWLGLGAQAPRVTSTSSDDVLQLRARCADLEERLRVSEERLRERSEALYELQKSYSKEHFELFESARNLKVERMRYAGAYSGLDVVLHRARALQARIAELKQRLRDYERVEDRYEDSAAILAESDQGTSDSIS